MTVLPINYVELDSANPQASRSFLQSAFGWKFTEFGPDYLGIDGAGLDGGISRTDDERKLPLIILFADDLDAAEAAVREAGGEITREQFDFPGGRRFHFREPGGNEMGVWAKPKG